MKPNTTLPEGVKSCIGTDELRHVKQSSCPPKAAIIVSRKIDYWNSDISRPGVIEKPFHSNPNAIGHKE